MPRGSAAECRSTRNGKRHRQASPSSSAHLVQTHRGSRSGPRGHSANSATFPSSSKAPPPAAHTPVGAALRAARVYYTHLFASKEPLSTGHRAILPSIDQTPDPSNKVSQVSV